MRNTSETEFFVRQYLDFVKKRTDLPEIHNLRKVFVRAMAKEVKMIFLSLGRLTVEVKVSVRAVLIALGLTRF